MKKGIGMSVFKLLCYSCGLTKGEAVEYLKVNENNALSWWLGRRPIPPGVLRDMRRLFDRIEKAAAKEAKRIEATEGDMTLKVPDDKEAQAEGWPFAGALEAVYRRALEMVPAAVVERVKVVKD